MSSIRKRTLTVQVAAVAFLSAAAIAASQTPQIVQVAEQGQTRITASTGDGRVDVTISTRIATSVEHGSSGATRCSGGRSSCSLVDHLSIKVGKSTVCIPNRATILLSDVNDGRVRGLSADHFELILHGGDAAAAYEAHLFFDKNRATKMDIWSSESHMIEQSTAYRDISKAFN